jgi:predicted acyl esterase
MSLMRSSTTAPIRHQRLAIAQRLRTQAPLEWFCAIAVAVLFSGGAGAEPQRSAASRHLAVEVPMRDGVMLTTDVYLPEGEGPWPAVLRRMPYARGAAGKQYLAELLPQHGYVFVLQSQRARFGSGGEWAAFQTEAIDGYDAVAWVAQQSWCDGRVATNGGSAGGINQYLMAITGPPALVCQHVVAASCNLYEQVTFPGGQFRKAQSEGWARENGVSPSSVATVRSHPHDDDYWANVNAEPYLAQQRIPVMHVAGWFDSFLAGNLRAFELMENGGGCGMQKLVIGPWTHGGLRQNRAGELTFPENAAWDARDFDQVRWFDHWLKKVDNGIMEEPPVRYYVMGAVGEAGAPGNEWRASPTWPVSAKETRFYFREGGALSEDAPAADEPADMYVHNPDDPVPTIGGRSLGIGGSGPRDQRPIEGRSDVLIYTSDVLDEPVEVTGQVSVHVWAASSAPDTDFAAKLCDVYPDGRSIQFAEGLVRARHRNTSTKDEFLVPWQPTEFEIDLWSTSVVFNRGHRLRVIISSSDYPCYDVNPGHNLPCGQQADAVRATNVVLHDREHASWVSLPVVLTE